MAVTDHPDDPTADQLRAARAMLGLSMVEASRQAKVSVATVAMIERGLGAGGGKGSAALRAAYEAAGVRFIGDGSGSGLILGMPPGRGPSSSTP